MRLYDMQNELAYLGDASASIRDGLRARVKAAARPLAAEAEKLAAELDRLNGDLVDRTGGLAQGDPKLREKVIDVYGSVLSYGGAPTASQTAYIDTLGGELKRAAGVFARLTGGPLETINAQLKATGQAPVTVPRRP
jgi:hypothetical protein